MIIKNYIPKRKLLCPKYDVVFRSLFKAGNEEITKALISDIIGENIQKIDLDKDRVQIKDYANEKLGTLDLKATLDNNTKCNIEIQLADSGNTVERFLYYWSKEYSRQLKQGENYNNLKRTIGIWILDFEINEEKFRKLEKCHTKWRIKENETEELTLTNKLEINIIEIPKALRLKQIDPNNKVIQWMLFLDNPNSGEVSKIMKDNKEIKKAMKTLEEVSDDEQVRRIAELKEKYILDERSRNNMIKKETEKNIARKLLESGIDIDTVLKTTGLSKNDLN